MNEEIKRWESAGNYCFIDDWKLRVFYREFGVSSATPQRTLLLLHGFPESSFSWHKIVDGMLEIFERIVVFDFPGFGLSDKTTDTYPFSILSHADVALKVWEYLGVKGGHLLSHDMGVSVGTELVSRQVDQLLPSSLSEGFQSYTFTNGSMVIDLAELRITQKILLTPIGFILSQLSYYGLFRQQVSSAHGNSNLSENDILLLWENLKLQKGHRKTHYLILYYNDRKRYEKIKWLPALGKTTVPIHLCWGDADQVARVEMAYYLKEHVCPKAQLSIIPDTGHFCQLGNPEGWVQSVRKFYKDSL